MGGHLGFYDLDSRLRELSAKGDDLERISALVDFEVFRLDLVSAVPRLDGTKGGARPSIHSPANPPLTATKPPPKSQYRRQVQCAGSANKRPRSSQRQHGRCWRCPVGSPIVRWRQNLNIDLKGDIPFPCCIAIHGSCDMENSLNYIRILSTAADCPVA